MQKIDLVGSQLGPVIADAFAAAILPFVLTVLAFVLTVLGFGFRPTMLPPPDESEGVTPLTDRSRNQVVSLYTDVALPGLGCLRGNLASAGKHPPKIKAASAATNRHYSGHRRQFENEKTAAPQLSAILQFPRHTDRVGPA